MRAVVSLGSNIGAREDYLSRALNSLSLLPGTKFLSSSTIKETEPVDVPTEYKDLKFLNQIALFDTTLSPEEFSSLMHKIEDDLGRVREKVNGPRTIDLDLIDFGGLVRKSPSLTLPHPRAKERTFVLNPLAELGISMGTDKFEESLDSIKDELKNGNRVLLLVRHAERPKIDNEDPSFGMTLALTDEGKRTSKEFGKIIKGNYSSLQFRASPLTRTIETAKYIAEGMGITNAEIETDEQIGNGSAFISNSNEVWELFRDGHFFTKMREYLNSSNQIGFNPLYTAADNFENYLMSHWHSQLGIFTTHDVYLAAYLHARRVKTDFCAENWPHFLDAAAIIIDKSGTRRYSFIRTNLSAFICGV